MQKLHSEGLLKKLKNTHELKNVEKIEVKQTSKSVRELGLTCAYEGLIYRKVDKTNMLKSMNSASRISYVWNDILLSVSASIVNFHGIGIGYRYRQNIIDTPDTFLYIFISYSIL